MPSTAIACRLREARDTCALAAMSINMRKKRQPVIWSVPNLPSDCSRAMAVPRGGVLVLSQNLLLYYAQVWGEQTQCILTTSVWEEVVLAVEHWTIGSNEQRDKLYHKTSMKQLVHIWQITAAWTGSPVKSDHFASNPA